MAKYWDPPIFTQNLFNQNDSEWPEMDFKHNFKKLFFLLFFEGFPNISSLPIFFTFSEWPKIMSVGRGGQSITMLL